MEQITIDKSKLMDIIEQIIYHELYKSIELNSYRDIAIDCSMKVVEKIQGGNKSRCLDIGLIDDVTLEILNVVPTPNNLTENAEVKWHMDRMEAIREKEKNKIRKPRPIKTKGEFKHPSNRTINCIGFEAAYDTLEGREYWRKRDEEFEEFKKNN